MMDLALVAPDLSEEDVSRGCQAARRYGLGYVTLRPCDVQIAVEWLKGSGTVAVAAVSYPHGAATTAVKNYETRDMLQRGARAIETPINLGKMRSRGFQYVEMELIQMVSECRRGGAQLILDIEWPSLEADLRIIACKIARRAEVDRVRAASLYGGGRPTMEDFTLLKAKLGDAVAMDAGAWVRTADDVKAALAAGAGTFQTVDAGSILDIW